MQGHSNEKDGRHRFQFTQLCKMLFYASLQNSHSKTISNITTRDATLGRSCDAGRSLYVATFVVLQGFGCGLVVQVQCRPKELWPVWVTFIPRAPCLAEASSYMAMQFGCSEQNVRHTHVRATTQQKQQSGHGECGFLQTSTLSSSTLS